MRFRRPYARTTRRSSPSGSATRGDAGNISFKRWVASRRFGWLAVVSRNRCSRGLPNTPPRGSSPPAGHPSDCCWRGWRHGGRVSGGSPWSERWPASHPRYRASVSASSGRSRGRRRWRSSFTPGTGRRTATSSKDSGSISGNSAFGHTTTECCSPEASHSWGSRQTPRRPLMLLDSPLSAWSGRCRGFVFADQLRRVRAVSEPGPRSRYPPRFAQRKMSRRTCSRFRTRRLKDLAVPSVGLRLADRRRKWSPSARPCPVHRRNG